MTGRVASLGGPRDKDRLAWGGRGVRRKGEGAGCLAPGSRAVPSPDCRRAAATGATEGLKDVNKGQ